MSRKPLNQRFLNRRRASVVIGMALSPTVFAADASWNVDLATASWVNSANWDTVSAPGATGGSTTNADTAYFTFPLTAGRTVTVDAGRNIRDIKINSASFGYTLAGGSLVLSNGGAITTSSTATVAHGDQVGSPMQIQGDGGAYSITSNSSGGSWLLVSSNAPITGVATAGKVTTLTLNGTSVGGSAGQNAINSIISDGVAGGKVAVVKDGPGIWLLNGSNTFSGGFTINGGQIRVAAGSTTSGTNVTSGSLGTGTLTIAGDSTISGSNSTGRDIYAPQINLNANLTIGDTFTSAQLPNAPSNARIRIGSPIIDLGNGTRRITIANASTALASGGAKFGFVVATSFLASGNIVVQNGTLVIDAGPAVAGSGLGYATLNLANVVGFANNGTLILGSNISTAIGTGNVFTSVSTTTPRLRLDPGAILDLSDQGNASRALIVSGLYDGPNGAGTVTNTDTDGPTTNGFVGALTVNISTGSAGFSGVIKDGNTGGIVSFTKGGGANQTLTGSSTYTGVTSVLGGTLSISSLNSVATPVAFSALGRPVTVANGTIPMGSNANAATLTYVGTGETTDRVINLAGTTGGAALFQNGTGLLKFTSSLTATGAGIKTLTLGGSTAGTGELAGAVVDNSALNTTSVAKSGTGSWTLSASNSYTGSTSIAGGTLVAGHPNALGAGNVSVASVGTLRVGSNLPAAVKLSSLTIDAGGVVNLTNGAAFIDYSASSPLAAVAAAVTSGFAGGAWTGTGITSTNAASVAANNAITTKTAIGYGEASTLGITNFANQPVDATTVLLRYTLVGDATLDQSVSSADFNLLVAAFGNTGQSWMQGDFNYDGVVDTVDFNLLMGSFGAAVPAELPGFAPGSVVPEPASVALLGAGACLLMRRRARRNEN